MTKKKSRSQKLKSIIPQLLTFRTQKRNTFIKKKKPKKAKSVKFLPSLFSLYFQNSIFFGDRFKQTDVFEMSWKSNEFWKSVVFMGGNWEGRGLGDEFFTRKFIFSIETWRASDKFFHWRLEWLRRKRVKILTNQWHQSGHSDTQCDEHQPHKFPKKKLPEQLTNEWK